MPFTVPDKGEGVSFDQSIMFQEYIDILVAGISGQDCVTSGCEVTAGTGLQLAVASGVVKSAGVGYTVGAATPTLGAAHATNPRFDLVVVNSSGAVAVRAGTASSTPMPPVKTANDVVLAVVYVPATLTTVLSGHIVDMRVLEPAVVNGAWELVSSVSVTAVASIDFDLQEDIYCEWKFVVDGIIPATDNTFILLRPGHTGGTVFDTANSTVTKLAGTPDLTVDNWVVIGGDAGGTGGIGSNAGEHAHAVITISGVGSTLAGGIVFHTTATWVDDQNQLRNWCLISLLSTTTERVWDSVRFIPKAGSFEASGTIKMYGLKRNP